MKTNQRKKDLLKVTLRILIGSFFLGILVAVLALLETIGKIQLAKEKLPFLYSAGLGMIVVSTLGIIDKTSQLRTLRSLSRSTTED